MFTLGFRCPECTRKTMVDAGEPMICAHCGADCAPRTEGGDADRWASISVSRKGFVNDANARH